MRFCSIKPRLSCWRTTVWRFAVLGSPQSPEYSVAMDVSADTNSWNFKLSVSLGFMLCRNKTVAYGLVRFLHKNYSVKVWKRSCSAVATWFCRCKHGWKLSRSVLGNFAVFTCLEMLKSSPEQWSLAWYQHYNSHVIVPWMWMYLIFILVSKILQTWFVVLGGCPPKDWTSVVSHLNNLCSATGHQKAKMSFLK